MLAGDLYAPRRPNGTGIVVLHGSSTRGRQLHLYPALCQALAARGYTLFNVDLRGYGESDDPPDPARPEDYDFVGDAIRAVRFAQAWESAQGIRNWILLGHSMGGGVAAHAGLQSAAIQGVVCISPGRRIEARFFAEASDQLKNLQRRKTRDMELPTPIPVDLLEPILGSYDVGRLSGTAWPKPFLLIEGAREPANDLEFSQAWFASLSGPVAHRVLPRADHYFGTAKVEVDGRKRWETTQPDVFDELVEIVDDWIQSNVGHR
jgi:pimeloyl-ACP methyl ester carboxylesterase